MTTTYAPSTGTALVYVVPCGTEKLDHAAPARDLYTAAHFQLTLATAERMAAEDGGRVLILSARHGLVELDEVLAPYEQRMDRTGRVTAEQLTSSAVAAGIGYGTQVFALLPRAYREALELALAPLDVYVADVYEGTPEGPQGGIGAQRRVQRLCREFYTTTTEGAAA